MYYCYLLRCSDNSLYCGQTNNLVKRIRDHSTGKTTSAKYTRSRRPVTLVYSESFATLSEALKREASIKRMTKTQKELLLNSYQNARV